jgi:CRISPR-associated protein Csm3
MIVRDAFMTKESIEKLSSLETELPYSEVKTEVQIDRVTSKANPRQMERVPAGAEFELEIVLDVCETNDTEDDESELLNEVLGALTLVQDDYLGGSGTRGYGKIKFKINNVSVREAVDYQKFSEPKPYNFQVPQELK